MSWKYYEPEQADKTKRYGDLSIGTVFHRLGYSNLYIKLNNFNAMIVATAPQGSSSYRVGDYMDMDIDIRVQPLRVISTDFIVEDMAP